MDTDAQGNRRPSKRKAAGRIDGIVCVIQAMGAATLNVRPEPAPTYRMFVLG
jgi:hypothetical protein